MIKLKKAAQDSVEGQQIYSSLIPYSFASIVLFGFIVSFFLWIKSVKISKKKLENYYDYISSLSLNESDSDDNNDYETFQQEQSKEEINNHQEE